MQSEHSVKSKTLPNHDAIHGVKRQKMHMMLDNPWTVSDLDDQYRMMSKVLDRYNKLGSIEYVNEAQRSLENLKTLRRECREGRITLNKLLTNTVINFIREK